MGPEQDETKPAGVRQYATTLHAPAGHPEVRTAAVLPPDADGGEPFELEGLQAQDAAGNLVYLWSRLRPGLHGAPEATGKLPMAVVQTVAQLVLEELGERLGRQAAGTEPPGPAPFPDPDPAYHWSKSDAVRAWVGGVHRSARVASMLAGQIGEALLPESLAVLVE